MTREEALKILKDCRRRGFEHTLYYIDEYHTAMDMAIEALEKEPKTGHWIRELIRNEKGGCIGAKMICSKCGNDNKHDEYMNYCPNCGAKMIEP